MTFFLEENLWSDLVQGVIDEQEEGPVERDVEEGGHQPGEVHIRAKKTISFQPKFGKWWGGRVSDRKKEGCSDGKMIACTANHWTPVVAAAASVPRSVIWPLSLLASSHLISSSFYCFIFLFNQTGSMELYFCIGWDCLCPALKIFHCHSYFENSMHIDSYLEDSLVLQGVKNKVLPLAGQWAEVLACLAREQFVNS